jgi:hypothetical protein
MSVDEMSFGKMACCQTKLLQWKMIGQEQNGTNKLSNFFFVGIFWFQQKKSGTNQLKIDKNILLLKAGDGFIKTSYELYDDPHT